MKKLTFLFPQIKYFSLVAVVSILVLASWVCDSEAATVRYVATNGNDSGNCASSACRTVYYGVSQMAGGDTLIVGNGTYVIDQSIKNIPSGTAGSYTTIQAETDFGVTLDGSNFTPQWDTIVTLYAKSYVKIQGFNIKGNPNNATSGPFSATGCDHIKIIRNGFSGAPSTSNNISAAVGPASSYVLLEENYSYSGARYQYLIYQSEHVVVRRNVARNDYYVGNWQAAGFANYDSAFTVWQNNIAIDSDTSCCISPTQGSRLWGGFWNENNEGWPITTSEEFHGNIVLNYKTDLGANYDPKISGTRVLDNEIYWDDNGGYTGDYWIGPAPSISSASNITSGGHRQLYNDAVRGYGTGAVVVSNIPNMFKNSIFANNISYGIANFAKGNFNAYSNNGANFGGLGQSSSAGPNDITSQNIVGNILKYLPRGPESGTALANGGEGGARIGAQVLWKYGMDGTLYGEPGWNVLRSPENGYGRPEDKLWPFPNETVIKAGMASYGGPGLSGTRGFAAPGSGLYGGPRTLTSYIWEYLGFPCPADICSSNNSAFITTSITSPGSGSTVSGVTTISASASSDVTVTKVEFYVGGVLKGTDTTSPYTYSWDTTQVSGGSTSLYSKVYDSAGKIGSSNTVSVNVNNGTTSPAHISLNPASLSFSATLGGSVPAPKTSILLNTGGQPLNFSASANQAWCHSSPASGTVAAGSSATLTVSVDALSSAGNNSCNISVSGSADNSPQNISVAYTVISAGTDNIPPTTSITSPGNGSTVSGVTTVSASASDAVGVTKVEFYVSGALKGTDTTSPYTYSWDTTQTPNGSAVITTKAYDATGNVGASGAVTLSVDNLSNSTGSTLFPADSWFYRDISNYPLDAENTLVTTALNRVNWGFGRLQIDFSIDVLKADASTPYVPFAPNSEAYLPDCDREPMPLPVGGNIEGESGYKCTQDGDCHLLVVDPTKHLLAEMYRAGAPASSPTFSGGCQVIWDTAKTVPLTGRGEMCTSADAAGYPIAPLLVNADEVYDAINNGKPINHALRFILPNDRIRAGWYLHPATHTPGPALTGDVDMPPYGTLLRLRSDYPIQNLPSEAAKVVARAMQKYGMYLADGGNIALTFQSDQHTAHKWSEFANFDARSMAGITPADFQMVDGGSRFKDLQQCTRTPITSSLSTSITSPGSGSTVSGITTISASASSDVTVTKVEFYVGGVLKSTDATSPYTYSWDTKQVSNGSTSLYSKVYDSAGKVGTSSTISVNVNNGTTSPAHISLNPASLSFSGSVGSAPAPNPGDPIGPAGYVYCANESGMCNFSGSKSVAYGVNPTFVYKDLSGGTSCTNAVFGDPAIGADKFCFVASTGGSAPTPKTSILTNSGSQVLNFSASVNQSWCHVSPASGTVAAGSSATLTASVDALSGAGNYSCNISISGNADNSPQNISVSYAVTANGDNLPPTTSITSPGNGSTVKGTISVSANVSDNSGSAASVSFKLDNGNPVTDTTAPFSVNWNTTLSASGTHTLTVTAKDAAGNISSPNVVTVTVNNSTADTTIPQVNITSPANGATVSGTIPITVNASDNIAVSSVSFKLDNGTPVVDTAAPFMVNWNTVSSSAGIHTLTVIAYDAAGNASSPSTVTLTVNNSITDTTLPSVNITSPANNSTISGIVSVQASASDNIGVASVSFKLDNGNPVVDTTAPYAVNWNTAYSAVGAHTLTATAKDLSGNVKVSTISVAVNR